MNENEKGYKRLNVWKEAHNLVLLVYKVTNVFPKEELFGLTSQLRRASISVPANIVEGYARSSKNELLQFLSIARGSLAECEYYIHLSRDLDYINDSEFALLEDKRHTVGDLLHGFAASIKRNNILG